MEKGEVSLQFLIGPMEPRLVVIKRPLFDFETTCGESFV
jgi:hypothetical protein